MQSQILTHYSHDFANLKLIRKLKATIKAVKELQQNSKNTQIKLEQEKAKNRDLESRFDKIKREMKKIEIVVKGHNIDFREWKETIISIEKGGTRKLY